MNQGNKKSSTPDNKSLSRIVTNKAVGIVEAIVAGERNGLTTEIAVSKLIDAEPNYFSRLRNFEGRFVSLDAIAKLVNKCDVNANYLFLLEGTQKKQEQPFRDTTTVNQSGPGAKNSVSHKNNAPVLQIGDNAVISGDIHQKVEKIMQGLSPKERALMKAQYEEFKQGRAEVSAMTSQVKELKKTLAIYEKTMKAKDETIKAQEAAMKKKDKEIEALNKKYIELLEKSVSKKR